MPFLIRAPALVLVLTGTLLAAPSGAPAGEAGSNETAEAIQRTAATERADELDWWTVDGGGGTSSGSTFALTGTIGQPDVGVGYRLDLALDGGLWSDGSADPKIFCDDFETGNTSEWSKTAGTSR